MLFVLCRYRSGSRSSSKCSKNTHLMYLLEHIKSSIQVVSRLSASSHTIHHSSVTHFCPITLFFAYGSCLVLRACVCTHAICTLQFIAHKILVLSNFVRFVFAFDGEIRRKWLKFKHFVDYCISLWKFAGILCHSVHCAPSQIEEHLDRTKHARNKNVRRSTFDMYVVRIAAIESKNKSQKCEA